MKTEINVLILFIYKNWVKKIIVCMRIMKLHKCTSTIIVMTISNKWIKEQKIQQYQICKIKKNRKPT